MTAMRSSNPLVGAWWLVSWENRAADGQVTSDGGGRHRLLDVHRRWPLLGDDLVDRPGPVRRGRSAQRDSRGEGPGCRGLRGLCRSVHLAMATASFITWSCPCFPTGWEATKNGSSSWPRTGSPSASALAAGGPVPGPPTDLGATPRNWTAVLRHRREVDRCRRA
jgi:hypothetical protein